MFEKVYIVVHLSFYVCMCLHDMIYPIWENHAIPIIYPFMVNLHKGASQFYDFNTRARAFLEQISAPK